VLDLRELQEKNAVQPALDPGAAEKRPVRAEDLEREGGCGLRIEVKEARRVRDGGSAAADDADGRAADRLADGVEETPGRRRDERPGGRRDEQQGEDRSQRQRG
jgi:hypothetical protein